MLKKPEMRLSTAIASALMLGLTVAASPGSASAEVGGASVDENEVTSSYAPSPRSGVVDSADGWTEEDYATAISLDLVPQPESDVGESAQRSSRQAEPLTVVSDPVAPDVSLPGVRNAAVPSTVGKLFFKKGDGKSYVCSAAVVNSNSKQLVVTAGHCVHGGKGGAWHTSFVFHPAYRDGKSPHGAWSYSRATTFKGWTDSSDFQFDQAVVQLKPLNGTNIVNKLGANGLVTGSGAVVKNTRVWGYPAASPFDGQIAYYCDRDTYASGSRDAAIDCGLNGGASGGPWLKDRGSNDLGYIWAVTSRCIADSKGVCTLKTMLAAPNPAAVMDLLT